MISFRIVEKSTQDSSSNIIVISANRDQAIKEEEQILSTTESDWMTHQQLIDMFSDSIALDQLGIVKEEASESESSDQLLPLSDLENQERQEVKQQKRRQAQFDKLKEIMGRNDGTKKEITFLLNHDEPDDSEVCDCDYAKIDSRYNEEFNLMQKQEQMFKWQLKKKKRVEGEKYKQDVLTALRQSVGNFVEAKNDAELLSMSDPLRKYFPDDKLGRVRQLCLKKIEQREERVNLSCIEHSTMVDPHDADSFHFQDQDWEQIDLEKTIRFQGSFIKTIKANAQSTLKQYNHNHNYNVGNQLEIGINKNDNDNDITINQNQTVKNNKTRNLNNLKNLNNVNSNQMQNNNDIQQIQDLTQTHFDLFQQSVDSIQETNPQKHALIQQFEQLIKEFKAQNERMKQFILVEGTFLDWRFGHYSIDNWKDLNMDIHIEQFETSLISLGEIGRGQFGTVTKYFDRNDTSFGGFYAFKKIPFNTPNDKIRCYDELYSMQTVNAIKKSFQHFVQLRAVYIERELVQAQAVYINTVNPKKRKRRKHKHQHKHNQKTDANDKQQYEYCMVIILEYGKCTLQDLLDHGRTYNEMEAIQISQQLLSSCYILQKHAIAQRDIKPSNIIVNKEMNGFKLADFGEAITHIVDNEVPLDDIRGTAAYLSPQMLVELYELEQTMNLPRSKRVIKERVSDRFLALNKSHSQGLDPFKSDVFSMGLVLCRVLGLKKHDIKKRVQYNESEADKREFLTQAIREKYPHFAKSGLLYKMLIHDEKARCSFEQALTSVEQVYAQLYEPEDFLQYYINILDETKYVTRLQFVNRNYTSQHMNKQGKVVTPYFKFCQAYDLYVSIQRYQEAEVCAEKLMQIAVGDRQIQDAGIRMMRCIIYNGTKYSKVERQIVDTLSRSEMRPNLKGRDLHAEIRRSCDEGFAPNEEIMNTFFWGIFSSTIARDTHNHDHDHNHSQTHFKSVDKSMPINYQEILQLIESKFHHHQNIIGLMYFTIGVTYEHEDNLEEAEQFLFVAYEKCVAKQDMGVLGAIHEELAIIFMKRGLYHKALEHFETCIGFKVKDQKGINNYDVAKCTLYKAYVLDYLNKSEESIKVRDVAFKILFNLFGTQIEQYLTEIFKIFKELAPFSRVSNKSIDFLSDLVVFGFNTFTDTIKHKRYDQEYLKLRFLKVDHRNVASPVTFLHPQKFIVQKGYI